MDRIETTIRKLFVAGIGAADLGAEKLGELLRICEERGEATVARGRAINEELKHTVQQAAAEKGTELPDLSALSDEERRALLQKLQALLGEEK